MPHITLIFGSGRGKTTAAMGKIISHLQDKKHIIVTQFLKSGKDCGECTALNRHPNIRWITLGTDSFFYPNSNKNAISKIIKKGIDKLSKLLLKEQTDVLVLDELAIALYFNLVSWEKISPLIQNVSTEVIITGRNPPRFFIELADSLITITEVKHPFQKGILARKGIPD